MENILTNKEYISNKLLVRIAFILKGNELMDKKISDGILKEINLSLQEYDYMIIKTIEKELPFIIK